MAIGQSLIMLCFNSGFYTAKFKKGLWKMTRLKQLETNVKLKNDKTMPGKYVQNVLGKKRNKTL